MQSAEPRNDRKAEIFEDIASTYAGSTISSESELPSGNGGEVV